MTISSVKFVERIRKAAKRAEVIGVTTVLFGAMTLAPEAAAAWTAKHGEESYIVNYHTVDRAEIENLQRWVAAGHEDCCKDAQLVAAEELKRIAEDFAADATQLSRVDAREGADGIGGAKRVRFEWTPLDGRTTYRVTVERFEWLLTIAKDADAMVWVPTVTEIQIHE